MAVNIINTPGDICLAKNQAIWQLRAAQSSGGDPYDATGVRSDMVVTFGDRFTVGQSITIDYTAPDATTGSIVFTAADPVIEDTDIPSDAAGMPDAEYWSTVVGQIGGNPLVAPFFTVELLTVSGSYYVRIQARETTGWTLDVTNDGGFTVIATAEMADSTPENYKIMFEVYFEQTYRAGDYILAAQLEGTPEPLSGFVYFDISSILAAQCKAGRLEPQIPQYGTDVPVLADNLRRYFIRYTEAFGSPIEYQPWTNSSIKLAMDGGVAQNVFAEADFLEALDVDDSLLSWQPSGRTIGMNEPEYIPWYNYTHLTIVSPIAQVKWYKVSDGSLGGTFNLYGSSGLSVRPKETALIPISPGMIGLAAHADAFKFTVQIGNDDPAIGGFAFIPRSQIRTYYLDREYYASERYIQYLNGFGVPECRRCTGVWSKKINISRSRAEHTLLPGYNSLATDQFQYAVLWDNTLTYRTGFISRAEAETLQEMLIAGEVYDVAPDGYIPLQMTTNDFEVTDTDRDLHSYAFQVQPRLDNRNYSKKKIATHMSAAWQDPGGEAWFDAFLVEWGLP